MIEFGPKLRSTLEMEASNPVRIAATPMMVPVPMITPSTVRKARSLWLRMVCHASPRPLKSASLVIGLPFRAKRLDGVELGGLARRVDPEEETDGGRETHAD